MRIAELEKPLTHAKKLFQLLQLKYQNLDAELVICSKHSQAPIDSTATILFEKLPSAFVDSLARKEALVVLAVIQLLNERTKTLKAEFLKNLTEVFKTRFNTLLVNLEIDESITIEIRFGELCYELIAALQNDPLVNQKLTPQTKSSIRIVIGTLYELKSRKEINRDIPTPYQGKSLSIMRQCSVDRTIVRTEEF